MQIMLPKSLNSLVAEVSEIISDTELKIKREFGGESGKGTVRVRERVSELRQEGVTGLEFKKLPFVDQQEMYRHVYQCLNEGGSIGIFPEGTFPQTYQFIEIYLILHLRGKPRSHGFASFESGSINNGPRRHGK